MHHWTQGYLNSQNMLHYNCGAFISKLHSMEWWLVLAAYIYIFFKNYFWKHCLTGEYKMCKIFCGADFDVVFFTCAWLQPLALALTQTICGRQYWCPFPSQYAFMSLYDDNNCSYHSNSNSNDEKDTGNNCWIWRKK